MNAKLVLFASAVLILIALYSFKNSSSDPDTQIAILGYHLGKSNDDNFIITYGDGSMEKVPFTFRPTSKESYLEKQQKLTAIMNQLRKKGFRLVSSDAYYHIFEK